MVFPMNRQVSLPLRYSLILVLITISLFFGSLISKNAYVLWLLALTVSYFTLKILSSALHGSSHRIQLSKGALCVVIVGVVIAVFPRYPYTLGLFSDHLTMPRLGDEPKHLSAITSIMTKPDAPVFAFDPRYPFSYYYLFYLIPSILTKAVPKSETEVLWLLHVFFTQIGFYSAGLYIIHALTKHRLVQNVSTLIFVFGSSLKIIPHTFSWFGIRQNHIEHWYHIPQHTLYGMRENVGWQISHPITIAIWTPQHQFSLMILLCVISVLIFQTPSVTRSVLIGILLFASLGSSVFVGIGTIGVVFLFSIFRFNPRTVKYDMLLLFVFGLLSLPLIAKLQGNTANFSFKPNVPNISSIPFPFSLLLFYTI